MAKANSNKVAKTSSGSRKSHNNKGKNTRGFSKMTKCVKHNNPNGLYPKLTKYGKIETVKDAKGNDVKVFHTNVTPAKTFTMHKLLNRKKKIGA